MWAPECGWSAYQCSIPNAPAQAPMVQEHLPHHRATAAPRATKAPHPLGTLLCLPLLSIDSPIRTTEVQRASSRQEPFTTAIVREHGSSAGYFTRTGRACQENISIYLCFGPFAAAPTPWPHAQKSPDLLFQLLVPSGRAQLFLCLLSLSNSRWPDSCPSISRPSDSRFSISQNHRI